MTRAVVLFPPPADLVAVLPVRKRFDPLAEVIPAHITLVFPFEDDLVAEALRTHIDSMVQGIGPVSLRLAGITGFEGEYLYLNVKRGNDALIELHDRLYRGPLLRHLSRTHTYVPHLTVGRLPNRYAFEQALGAAPPELCVETICASVSVYRMSGEAPGTVESEIALRRVQPG
jgi:2'-5' RNA ligase